jgi:hypothetical protein
MPTLSKEIGSIQNTALSAVLIWRATAGFSEASDGTPCPLPLLFLILPILYHEDTAALAIQTRKASGLQLFAKKFSETTTNKSDVLLGISPRAIVMRRQSLEALRLAISSRLIALRRDNGDAFPVSTTAPIANTPQAVRPLLNAAEKIGYWFGQRTLFEIQQLLKVHL